MAAVAILQITLVLSILVLLYLAMLLHGSGLKSDRVAARERHDVTRDMP